MGADLWVEPLMSEPETRLVMSPDEAKLLGLPAGSRFPDSWYRFRDAYNVMNLLAHLGLSWNAVETDADGLVSDAEVAGLLRLVCEREVPDKLDFDAASRCAPVILNFSKLAGESAWREHVAAMMAEMKNDPRGFQSPPHRGSV